MKHEAKRCSAGSVWENRVLAAVMCRTARNPITGEALAEQFGTTLRTVSMLVEKWRDAGIKIGSMKGRVNGDEREPMGYFLARTPEELLETVQHMESMARNIYRRAQRLKRWDDVQPTLYEQEIPLEG